MIKYSPLYLDYCRLPYFFTSQKQHRLTFKNHKKQLSFKVALLFMGHIFISNLRGSGKLTIMEVTEDSCKKLILELVSKVFREVIDHRMSRSEIKPNSLTLQEQLKKRLLKQYNQVIETDIFGVICFSRIKQKKLQSS